MMKNFIKHGVLVSSLFLSSISQAATFNFSEAYAGEFSQSTTTTAYSLSGSDGSFPILTSTASLPTCANAIGCTGTGNFSRDAGAGNTFFGTFDFIVNTFTVPDSAIYALQVGYSGGLNVTGGTGIFDGASGIGSFSGLDLYFALITDSPPEITLRTILQPDGVSQQLIELTVNTPDVNAVPIPAAAWLFGSGLVGFFGMRRKAIA